MNTPQLMRALRRGVPRNCLVNLPSVFDIPVLVALGSAAIIFIGMSAIRKRNNQTSAQEESLLAARTSAEITTQCQFRGRQHTLIVHREGNVLLTKARTPCSLSKYKKPSGNTFVVVGFVCRLPLTSACAALRVARQFHWK